MTDRPFSGVSVAVDPVWIRWREDAIYEGASASAREAMRTPMKLWPLFRTVEFGADVLVGYTALYGDVSNYSADTWELCDPPKDSA